MSSAAEEEDSTGFDQSRLAAYMRRQIVLPMGIFLLSFGIYLACALGAVLARGISTKVLLDVLAGVFIANLAIIAHDAIHRSFTPSRSLNRLIGTVAFLPGLHAFGRWEHHHNRVHHRYTAQIGVDNAYSPMTVEQFRAASTSRRLYYRFMRSLAGQPFFYMLDIWLPKMFLPSRETGAFRSNDWFDLVIVYLWLALVVSGLTAVAHFWLDEILRAAVWNAALFGMVIPFLVFNLIASFVTIVQHTGPNARWILPAGRPSTHVQKLRGTVHIRFPEVLDWFFHGLCSTSCIT